MLEVFGLLSIFKTLAGITGEKNVILNEPMKNHTSFRTGGEADIFVSPDSIKSLKDVIKLFRENDIPFYIFGNGSNMLVSDRGIEGAVIHIGNGFSSIEVKENKITSGAGAILSAVSNAALENSLTGFEFASGIPGSFGGAVFMNAGAYGSEIKNVIKSVLVLNENLELEELSKDRLELGYRSSIFQKNNYIILGGTIELETGNKDNILSEMNELNAKRREKQPLNFASAGSTFKRPEGYFAGKLIEDSGLKGKTIGGAQVSEKHAGFIVNTGTATTDDIINLMDFCKKTVYEKFGVMIEPEVRITGRP